MNPEFSLLTNTNSSKFEEVLAIYLDVFPASERQCVDVVKERIASGKTILLIAEVNECVVGFAILWNLEHSDFALLDYLGVDRKLQQMGIGPAIMDEVKRMSSNWGKDLILEIEHPGEGDNREDRKRRLRFYLKSGALILKDVPYLLPALDGTVPTAMLLLTIPTAEKKFYSGAEITALIRDIYGRVYKKESDDADLQLFIHLIPERIELTTVCESLLPGKKY